MTLIFNKSTRSTPKKNLIQPYPHNIKDISMYDILELNAKLVGDLRKIAENLGISKIESLKKKDLVYRILDEQALKPNEAARLKKQEKSTSDKTSPIESGSEKKVENIRLGLNPEEVRKMASQAMSNADTPNPKSEKVAPKPKGRPKKKVAEDSKPEVKIRQEEVAAAEAIVVELREKALSKPTDTAYFALFTTQRDALAAVRGNIGGVADINMSAEAAPSPDEINWQALWSTYHQRALRTVLAIPIILIVLIFPIGPLTGAMTNLELAVCGGTADTNHIYWPWFCEGTVNAARTLITGTSRSISLENYWPTVLLVLVVGHRFYV